MFAFPTRNGAKPSPCPRPARRRRAHLSLEALEVRSMPAVVAPAWVEQGPGPITSALGGLTEAGAVQALVSVTPDVLFAGTVNGGVWETTNGTAAQPAWKPLTDSQASLAVGALAVDPTNANTLYAGTGSFTAGAVTGGSAAGVLKSTDGGKTWSLLAQSTFTGLRLRSVVPGSDGKLVLAATPDGAASANKRGLYRSTDGGQTWARVSGTANSGLPDAGVTEIAADPADPHRFYAAVFNPSAAPPAAADGSVDVYRSTNDGQAWTKVQTLLTGLRTGRGVFATYHNGTQTVIYAAGVGTGTTQAIFRSTNQGDTWRQVQNTKATNPSQGGSLYFAIAADPKVADVLYVAGDQVNSPDGDRYRVTLNDTSPAQDAWTSVALAGANNTSPHANARRLVFDANGDLLEADGGGVYRLTTPDDATKRKWTAQGGNLHVTEFYSVAYDPLNHLIVGGAEDSGTPMQSTPGSTSWKDLTASDGTQVAVDATSTPGSSIYYVSTPFLTGFSRVQVDSTGKVTSTTPITLTIVDRTGKSIGTTLTAVDASGNFSFDPTIQPVQPYAVNAVDPKRLLIGTSYLYESRDRGQTLSVLSDLDTTKTPPVPKTVFGAVSALAYGGTHNGVANADIAYVGVGGQKPGLWFRAAVRTGLQGDFTQLTNYPGKTAPRAIALDPSDWQRVYVVDSSHVYFSADAGQTWTDETGTTLTKLSSDLWSVAVIAPTSDVTTHSLAVGGLGGVFNAPAGLTGATTTWSALVAGLPNVVVHDLHFDTTDQVLLAGTYGRGAFTLGGAITGTVFEDVNGDGTKQDTEPGQKGWTVFADLNGNGTLDKGEPSAVSDANGVYTLRVGPGTYKVREVVPAGWIQTTTNPGDVVNSTLGETDTGVDFGNFQTVTLKGTLFLDTNKNGTQDAGEPGVANLKIFLDTNNNGTPDPTETTTVTGLNGSFQLPNLGPGTYHVRAVLNPSGDTQTTPNADAMVGQSGVAPGAANIGIFFNAATVAGRVFVDANANGVYNPANDPGLGGVTVQLFMDANASGKLDAGDVLSKTTTTAADGTYALNGLYPGKYVVHAARTGRTFQTAPTPSGDYAIQLDYGLTVSGQNFGFLAGPNQAFVAQLYEDLLERHVDASGLAVYGSLLDQGKTTRDQVARALITSVENRTRQVVGLYSSILQRKTDPQGLQLFVSLLMSGKTIEQVTAMFYGSAEYFVKFGQGTNLGFLQALYTSALGRNLDPTGQSNLLGLLNLGISRENVALRVLTSREKFTLVVTDFYNRLLRRQPDAGGLQTYVSLLLQGATSQSVTGMRDGDVIIALTASPEYFNRL